MSSTQSLSSGTAHSAGSSSAPHTGKIPEVGINGIIQPMHMLYDLSLDIFTLATGSKLVIKVHMVVIPSLPATSSDPQAAHRNIDTEEATCRYDQVAVPALPDTEHQHLGGELQWRQAVQCDSIMKAQS
eukprot:39035-Eustigmatos_ZCMA.PRE.1